MAIANVGITVSAETQQYTKNLNNARRTTVSFASSLKSVAKAAAGFATVIAGAKLAQLTILTKRAFAAIGVTTKLADILGIATEELTALQFAAEQTGSSTAQMNRSLQTFGIRIGEALTGTGKAADTLKRLGLTAEQLTLAGPAEAFKLFSDAVNKLPNAVEKSAAAAALFGNANVALVNTMALGREGLADMAVQAEALGFTFDRVGGEKIVQANRAINLFGLASASAGRVIAIELAPFLTAAVKAFVEFGQSGEGMGVKVVNAFNFVLQAAGMVADTFELLKAAFLTLRGVATIAILGIVGTFNFLLQSLITGLSGDVLDALGLLPEGLKEFAAEMDNLTDDFIRDAEDSFAGADAAMGKFLSGENAERMGVFFKTITDDAQALAEVTANFVTSTNAFRAVSDVFTGRKDEDGPGRGRSGLRSLVSVGGVAGAQAVASAAGRRNQELLELKKQTTLLNQMLMEQKRGGLA